MAEYISREFMLKNLEADKMNNAEHCEPVTVQIMERFIRYVSEFPATNVQPVKRGRWENEYLEDDIWWAECSNCKQETHSRYGRPSTYRYCPNCGARMDGEQND